MRAKFAPVASPHAQVFGRRQQLGLRSQIKGPPGQRGRKKANPDAEDDGAQNAKGRGRPKLARKKSRSCKSPAMKRLKKLRKSSSQKLEDDEPGQEAAPEQASASPVPEVSSPPSSSADGMHEGDGLEAKASPKSKKPAGSAAQKGKGKAKAKASPKAKGKAKAKASPRAKGKAKAKASPKAKGKAKAKAASNDRQQRKASKSAATKSKNKRGKTGSSDIGETDLGDADYLVSYYGSFEYVDANPKKLKNEVRDYMEYFTNVAPDIYWSRSECGLSFRYVDAKNRKHKKLVGFFRFGATRVAMLVSIGCCLCLVPRLVQLG